MQWFKGIGHHLSMFKLAWREQSQQEPVQLPKGKELEFLPAVLELQETPPSPLGRTTIFIIIAVFVLAIVWATFGKVDIVTVAQGKIIPSDRTKVIQPLGPGVIKAIHIKDGQRVKTGDILIELDPTAAGADMARFSNEYMTAKMDVLRLRALIAGQTRFKAPQGADPALVKNQQQLLQDQVKEHKDKLESARLQIRQRQAAVGATRVRVHSHQQTLAIIKERLSAMQSLLKQKIVTRMSYLEAKEQAINKRQELATARKELMGQKAALAESKKNREGIESEFLNNKRAELSVAETRAKSLSSEVIKAETTTKQQTLRAPIDGVVQQLAVHTIGGVVTPAQQLMIVVPRKGLLEVEAWVENKDIGSVNQDQTAEIKVEAFPFTRFGTIDGTIITLSKDAVPLENVGFVYNARVTMSRTTMQVKNKEVKLTPGMNVTVEIKTGKRRVIEFFLNPLLRGIKETARER